MFILLLDIRVCLIALLQMPGSINQEFQDILSSLTEDCCIRRIELRNWPGFLLADRHVGGRRQFELLLG
jgi:hypothetical protein